MTPIARGTFDQSATGAFVQGHTGDRNRIATDVMVMMLEFESESSTAEESYAIPSDVSRGVGFYDEDLAAFRATVGADPRRTIRMAVGWMFNTTLQFTVNIIPAGFSFPEEFAVERIGFQPLVIQADPSPYRALFDSQAAEFSGPFTLFLVAQGFLVNLLRPALASFVSGLPDEVDVELRADSLSGDRWIRDADGFV